MTATERMYECLEKQGKKPAELVRHLGISSSVMAGWKASAEIPPSKYLVRISEFLNISEDYLLTGKEEVENTSLEDEASSNGVWNLHEYQKTVAERYFEFLTVEQVALINNFEKLDYKDKEEIKILIEHKLKSKPTGLSSNSPTSNGGSSGASTA